MLQGYVGVLLDSIELSLKLRFSPLKKERWLEDFPCWDAIFSGAFW